MCVWVTISYVFKYVCVMCFSSRPGEGIGNRIHSFQIGSEGQRASSSRVGGQLVGGSQRPGDKSLTLKLSLAPPACEQETDRLWRARERRLPTPD